MDVIIDNITTTMEEGEEDPIKLWKDPKAFDKRPDNPIFCPLTPPTGLNDPFSLSWLKENDPSFDTKLVDDQFDQHKRFNTEQPVTIERANPASKKPKMTPAAESTMQTRWVHLEPFNNG